MRAGLTDNDVLNLRESGQQKSSVERALMILSAACPEASRQRLAALPVGERDARLLAIRERTFGAVLEVFTICPACRQELELSLTTTSLRAPAPADRRDEDCAISTRIGDLAVRYRLPDSTDMEAMAACGDIDAARKLLLERCILELRGATGEREWAADEGAPAYTPDFVAALAGDMAQRDPQAEVLLNLQCAECRHEWQSLFDIATFFWDELETHGKRLLHEINLLARAYHWREQDILGLSPARRRWYLEMVST